jgi:hypothetical protein
MPEDAIGSHSCSLEASRRVTNVSALGLSLFFLADSVNCATTLKKPPVLKPKLELCRFADDVTTLKGLSTGALQAANHELCHYTDDVTTL